MKNGSSFVVKPHQKASRCFSLIIYNGKIYLISIIIFSGAIRSHTDYFKQIRDLRIDRFVVETNKLLIRLDKLVGPDVPTDPGKRRRKFSNSDHKS